jgi:ribosomal protein S18 acetylase RimI-like enzyme
VSVGVEVRDAREDELDRAGEVVAEAYLTQLDVDEHGWYLARVRDARSRAREAEVLVAVDAAGAVLGCVTYVPDHANPWAEVERPGEAGFRMLGVLPAAARQGVGRALVDACIARARAAGRRGVAITTGEDWTAARQLYEGRGFRRAPERDFEPVPGVRLVAYVLPM